MTTLSNHLDGRAGDPVLPFALLLVRVAAAMVPITWFGRETRGGDLRDLDGCGQATEEIPLAHCKGSFTRVD